MSSGTVEQWNKLVLEHGPKSGAFLQSWEWGEFQKTCGRKVFRFLITPVGLTQTDAETNAEQHRDILGVMQIIKLPLPMGKSYLYIPRGPIVKIPNDKFLISNLGKLLENLAKKENAIFIKLELPIENNQFDTSKILDSKFYILNSVQPRDTLILELSRSEEELLAAMHEKTRYNIRLAERKGVEVRWSQEETLEKDIEIFWKLAEKTAARDKFSYHSKKYYEKMLALTNDQRPTTNDKLVVRLIIAEKDGEPLGANIITFFRNTATYLHGASNHEYRELMAPHLLQWRAIQEAKKLGYKFYDFWGIAPELQATSYKLQAVPHPWGGITRFKLGFGGEQIHYALTLDLPVSNFWYNLYTLGKKIL